MKRLLQRILTKPVIWLANKFSSRPNLQRVHTALTELYQHCIKNPGKKGLVLEMDAAHARFIIFSDQHKGAKDGSDDFMNAEPTYLQALQYYLEQDFHFISLGDEEELWENLLGPVKANNKKTIALQKEFLLQQRYTKVFGNHDTFWNNDPFAGMQLKSMYHSTVAIYEAVLLNLKIEQSVVNIFLTHGHQGDGLSDTNWFSAWFVGRVWAPLQSFLNLNPNLPATNDQLKTLHNRFMYEWSKQENNPILITGHTHQPVFASLTHLEKLYQQLDIARRNKEEEAIDVLTKKIRYVQEEYDYVINNYNKTKPCYFNSGCCCFTDGDITGIEIADAEIRLIKWHKNVTGYERIVLEKMLLQDLL